MFREPLSEAFLYILQPMLKLSVFGKHSPHANKRAYDYNARMNRYLAAQNVSCHDRAVLCEYIRSITPPASRFI